MEDPKLSSMCDVVTPMYGRVGTSSVSSFVLLLVGL
jgi:hypothetical protein